MIVDIIVVVILLASALIAFMRGFIRETLTVLGVVGGLVAAYSFGGMLVPVLSDMLGVTDGEKAEKLLGVVPMDMVALALGYGLTFLVVVGLLSVASHFIAESVKSLGLGAVDRSLGVVFGLARGVVILGIAYLPFYLLMNAEDKETWFGKARSYFYLEKTAEAMATFIPSYGEGSDQKMDVAEDKNTQESSTRAHLQAIDLLKREMPLGLVAPTKQDSEDGAGYEDEFRTKMNELFEQKAGQYNE